MTKQSNARLFADPNMPEDLIHKVFARVALARRRTAFIRLAVLGFGLVISGGVLIPALQYALHELYTSGFYDYLTLAFSDSSAFSHWRELSLTLLESIPSLAILLLTGILGFIGWSLKHATRHVRVALNSRQQFA